MSINALSPFAGNNAIQSVGFAIDLASPLSADQIKTILDDPDLRRALPERRQPNFSFNIDVATGRLVQNEALTSGQLFSPNTNLPGSVLQGLMVGPGIVVNFNAYKSWTDTLKHVLPTIERVLEIAKAVEGVAVGLQYTDIFDWRGTDEINFKEIFQEGNPFIPPGSLDKKSLWHAHHGYLEQLAEPVASQIVENVNVNVIAEDGALRIVIVTSHKGSFANLSGGDLLRAFNELSEAFHDRNKRILCDLLTKEVAAKIGLGAKP